MYTHQIQESTEYTHQSSTKSICLRLVYIFTITRHRTVLIVIVKRSFKLSQESTEYTHQSSTKSICLRLVYIFTITRHRTVLIAFVQEYILHIIYSIRLNILIALYIIYTKQTLDSTDSTCPKVHIQDSTLLRNIYILSQYKVVFFLSFRLTSAYKKTVPPLPSKEICVPPFFAESAIYIFYLNSE